MKDKIILGETPSGARVELDLQELITGRTLLCCISRFGKTWTARRIVEQIFGKTGIIIVDVEGEYATLRDKYPLLIIGKDVPLIPESAEFLADQVLEHDLSCIIDGSDPQLDVAAFQEFIARFIERFIAIETKARKPFLWILEEADELSPETGIARSICLGQIRKLVKKGGKRGLGTIVLTQRPAFVSKFVISQCPNKIIGRTEWPDDLAVLRKFGRIPEKYADPESRDQHALKNLEKGQFYVAGDFVAKDTLVKVGPVETKHLGSTPEIIPPAPKELKQILQQLSERLPSIIQEKLAPAVPKVAEIEARLREKFEAQWQARLGRKEKELSGVKNRLESKYETEIADLRRKLEEAVRQAAVKGPVADLLSHPLVQKNLEKLNAKQRSLIELLEAKGPQDPEHCSLFLEVSPKNVPDFVYKINSRIPKLIESVQGRYASRLAKLFPVTEEAKAEARETEDLRAQLNGREAEIIDLKRRIELIVDERTKLERSLNEALKEKIELSKQLNALQSKPATSETPHPAGKEVEKTKSQDAIGVDVTLRRVVTSFKVAENKEIFDVDESSWEGKILARGLDGFFQEPKGIGKIMAELVRRYNIGDSGGNRTTVNDRLAMLVSKGILDRKQEAGQWVYSATPEFSERVKNSG
jgi:predicted nuclease with TOPRIM domain